MVPVTTLSGRVGEIPDGAVREFARQLSGRLLLPADAGYDDARMVWNRMIDRRPALIARCAGPSDVVAAVRFARERDLLLSVRSGGHNVTGHAVCDRGLMIEKNVEWARATSTAMRPFMSGGAYVNYLDADAGADEVRAAYGPAYERLIALKEKYDPRNIFRLNQNIRPSASR